MKQYASWIEAVISTSEITQQLERGALPRKVFRHIVQNINQQLKQQFYNQADINDLIKFRAAALDKLFAIIWQQQLPQGIKHFSFIATGGYGRGELHPGSDLDVLILAEDHSSAYHEELSALLALLWDLGLHLAHSVRTIEQCLEDAKTDIHFATSLLEARFICGKPALFAQLQQQIYHSNNFLSSAEFLQAKLQEQEQRHKKFDEVEYHLEPNLKSGPGALRDIHLLLWLQQHQYHLADLNELINQEILSPEEYQELIEQQHFLWQVRFALHFLAERNENRILFDYQPELSRHFGYQDENNNLAVEQFMKCYFRSIAKIHYICELALQALSEKILNNYDTKPVALSLEFHKKNNYLATNDQQLFNTDPTAIFRLFICFCQHQDLIGIHASCIRQIKANLQLIDTEFRNSKVNFQLFLEILQQPKRVTKALLAMLRYGVLSAYIPQFSNIIGQMQYDLFHIYTVDVHVIQLINYLRRFAKAEHQQRYPLCNKIIHQLDDTNLLYITALFHDIAKGQDGDHSELGANWVQEFCQQHELQDEDTALITWLVKHHLLLSHTAQSHDLADPDVIEQFANQVGSLRRLDYLYVFTVADVCATNIKLWNNWRDALFQRLYRASKNYLAANAEDAAQSLYAHQQNALKALTDQGFNGTDINKLWQNIPDRYFSRESTETIIWHSTAILAASDQQILVQFKELPKLGCAEILVYLPNVENLFATVVYTLDQIGIKIAEARVLTTKNNYALDSFDILPLAAETQFSASLATNLLARLRNNLDKLLNQQSPPSWDRVLRRSSKKLSFFPQKFSADFSTGPKNKYSLLRITSHDRPGVLSNIARVFSLNNINIYTAKLQALGDQLESSFAISKHGLDGPLEPDLQTKLSQELASALAATQSLG